jgi:hypothetical protein
MYVCLWCLASLSTIVQLYSMLLHVFPRHSVQATEHSRPCFLQLQRFESQFVLHLQYIVFRSSSGAGGKLASVNILYASSTGRAAFMGDDAFVNPLCVGFCILWINGCIREFRTTRELLLKACTKCGKLHKMGRKHVRLF